MLTRVLHLSDLHFGAADDDAIERGAPILIERFGPELVIASGDLSHRGREDQLARATRFLRSLGGFSSVSLGTFAASGGSHVFYFHVTLPTTGTDAGDNLLQGLSSSTTFTWSATQT